MEYQVSQLVSDIKVVLDRNNAYPSLELGEAEALSLDQIVESRILPAASYIAIKAPLELIDNSKAITGSVVVSDGVGTIQLPTDFLRLHDIGMASWQGRVQVIDDKSPLYAQQKSRFGGVRGNAQAPVAAMVKRGNQWLLELYSCTADDVMAHGSYVAAPAISNNKIDLSTQLKDSVVYYAAYLACLSMGDTETAPRLLEPVKNMLE